MIRTQLSHSQYHRHKKGLNGICLKIYPCIASVPTEYSCRIYGCKLQEELFWVFPFLQYKGTPT